MNPPESEGTIAWRLGSVERDVREERAARREAVEKLDSEKADSKDVKVVATAVDELRGEMRRGIDGLRKLFQWFVGIVAIGVIALLGIIVQQLSQ